MKPFLKKYGFALILSLIYLVIIFIYGWLTTDHTKPLPLNELGDLLAGVFAPLAFLFLILGYKQQGQELKQNTEALKLQAEELANLVKEQELLNEMHKIEQNQRIFEKKPYVEISKTDFAIRSTTRPIWADEEQTILIDEHEEEEGFFKLNITIKNNPAREVELIIVQNTNFYILKSETLLEPYGTMHYEFTYTEDELEAIHSYNDLNKKNIILRYKDIYGTTFEKKYLISIRLDGVLYVDLKQFAD